MSRLVAGERKGLVHPVQHPSERRVAEHVDKENISESARTWPLGLNVEMVEKERVRDDHTPQPPLLGEQGEGVGGSVALLANGHIDVQGRPNGQEEADRIWGCFHQAPPV